MADSQVVVRVLLSHYLKKGHLQRPVKFAAWKGLMTALHGSSFQRFNSEDTDSKTSPDREAHSTTNDEVQRQAVENNPSTSTRHLSAQLDPSQSTIVLHLHKPCFSTRQSCPPTISLPSKCRDMLMSVAGCWQTHMTKDFSASLSLGMKTGFSCGSLTARPGDRGGCPTRPVQEKGYVLYQVEL